jgi:hypothetical protein
VCGPDFQQWLYDLRTLLGVGLGLTLLLAIMGWAEGKLPHAD